MRIASPKNGLYTTRMKVFVAGCCVLLLICLVRLAQMQLGSDAALRISIEELKKKKEHSRQFPTLRGRILDRNGKVLAMDKAAFTVQISYQLSQYADPCVLAAKKLALEKDSLSDTARTKALAALDAKRNDLLQVWERSAYFLDGMDSLAQTIKQENDRIWTKRIYQAWRDYCKEKNTEVYRHYQDVINVSGAVPVWEYRADFARTFPDPNDRLRLIEGKDIREMRDYYPLYTLETDEAVLAAQMEFADINDVKVASLGKRTYPKGTVAAQTIGWVGPATQDRDKALFADDPLAEYRPDEVCGREDGVEYLCEPILRGRRGLETHDLDNRLIESVDTEIGRNITLTLDIKLQEEIETYLLTGAHAPYCKPGMAVVLIDVGSADILALVSLPTYDLNTIRQTYGELPKDPNNNPLINRALARNYKPGSTAKPLVLAAGLETGTITPDKVISCPDHPAPKSWPNCWYFRASHGMGHDSLWENTARNAIKGSCNIYFSHLANDIPPRTLQEWFFKFGYGRQVPLPLIEEPDLPEGSPPFTRRLRQAAGKISSRPVPWNDVITKEDFNDITPLLPAHRKLAGMGEGEIYATILQIANSMATLARHGITITPRLFLPDPDQSLAPESQHSAPNDLGLSETTLATILEGMEAVVNEHQGTAHEAFAYSDFAAQGVKAYGKTGSTEKPNNALFAGFARDIEGSRAIAIALVVEGGESGARDAAPLARTIWQRCIDFGYLGKSYMASGAAGAAIKPRDSR